VFGLEGKDAIKMNWADEVEEGNDEFVLEDEQAAKALEEARLQAEKEAKERAAKGIAAPQPQPASVWKKPAAAPPPQPIPRLDPTPVQQVGSGRQPLAKPASSLGLADVGKVQLGTREGAASSRWKNHIKTHDAEMVNKRREEDQRLQERLRSRPQEQMWPRGETISGSSPSPQAQTQPAGVEVRRLRHASSSGSHGTSGSGRLNTWSKQSQGSVTALSSAASNDFSLDDVPDDWRVSKKKPQPPPSARNRPDQGRTAPRSNALNVRDPLTGEAMLQPPQQVKRQMLTPATEDSRGTTPSQSASRSKQKQEDPRHSRPSQLQGQVPAPSTAQSRDGTAPLANRQQQLQRTVPRPASYGYIASLKKDFGFIRSISENHDSDVFFHFDETSKNGLDVSKLKIGDEVEFILLTNRDGRLNANQVRLLEKGTIQIDERVEELQGATGIVTMESPRIHMGRRQPGSEAFHGRGGAQDDIRPGSRIFNGRIALTSEEVFRNLDVLVPEELKTEAPDGEKVFGYSVRDMKQLGKKTRFPAVGDIVKFDVAKEMLTERIHAVSLEVLKLGRDRFREIVARLVEAAGEDARERGRINLLPLINEWNGNATGLLECESRSDLVRFPLNELPEEFQPQKSKSKEQIKKEADKLQKKKKYAEADWRSAGESAALAKQQTLAVGLEFEFVLVKDPADPERFLAAALKSVPRGTVTLEEFIGKDVAGTLSQMHWKKEDVSDQSSVRSGNAGSSQLGKKGGILQGKVKLKSSDLELPENLQAGDDFVELDFAAEDLSPDGPRPQQGDMVVLNVWKVKRTGKLLCRDIQLSIPFQEEERIEAGPLGGLEGKCSRETGVVHNVKEHFGFIDCYERPGQMFFPMREVIADRASNEEKQNVQSWSGLAAPKIPIRAGQLVSFGIQVEAIPGGKNSTPRPFATRVLKLDTLDRDIILAENASGIVVKAPTPTKHKTGSYPGKDGNSRPNSQPFEPGVVRCKPPALLAPQVFDVLRKFTLDELYIGDEKQNKKATRVEVVIAPCKPFGGRHGGGRRARGSSKRESSGPEDKAADAASAASGNMFSLNVDMNSGRTIKDYCAWLNLRWKIVSPPPPQSTKVDFILDPAVENVVVITKGKVQRRPRKDSSAEVGMKDSEGEREVFMTAIFTLVDCQDRRSVKVGDEVSFALALDRRTFKHLARKLKVTKFAERVVPVRPRRSGTEVGIVASVHDQGFGFVYSVDCGERLFFRFQQCEVPYRPHIEAGDEIEFKTETEPRGTKAVDIWQLPKGSIVLDEVLKDPDTNEPIVLRGTIVKEARTPRGDLKFKANDHPFPIKMAKTQVSAGLMGKIILNSASMTPSDEAVVATPEYEQPSWRRTTELDKSLKSFVQDNDLQTWSVPSDLPFGELKEIEKMSRRGRLVVRWTGDHTGLVIAKNKGALEAHLNQENGNLEIGTEESTEDSTGQGKAEAGSNSKNEDEIETSITASEENQNGSNAAESQQSAIGEEEKEDADKEDEAGSDADDELERSVEQEKNKREKGKKEKKKEKENAQTTKDILEGVTSFFFTLGDISDQQDSFDGKDQPTKLDDWVPRMDDEVEFTVVKNLHSGKLRASDLKLIKQGAKISRGVIEGTISARAGFVRPLVAGESSESFFGTCDVVDEALRPGGGGRDGTIRFDPAELPAGLDLYDGDEVEYTLVINARTREARATRLHLIRRAPEQMIPSQQKQVSKDTLKRIEKVTSAMATQQFSEARRPPNADAIGFPAGRGRNLPVRTKLRITAKEFRPSSS